MSDKKTSSSRFSVKIDDFSGIDASAKNKNPVGSSRIVNFRIDKNGSLKKRCGFKEITSTPNNIDGVWYGKLFGKSRMIIVSDSTVYEHTDEGLSTIGKIYGFRNSDFSMFFYNDCLYFLNGAGMYQLDENGISVPNYYAPLIGKDWPSGWIGPIHEKKNLLSDYVRITYVIGENMIKYLRLTDKVDMVISLTRNGALMSEEEYVVDNDNMAIHLYDVELGDRFELTALYVTATDPLSVDARSATQCTLFGGIEKKRPYFWGTDKGDAIYVSKQLTVDQKNEVQNYLPCIPIYVTEDDIIKVGTGNHKVMGLTKHFGRTLIFTENDAWRATEDGEAALGADEEVVPISNMAPININTAIGVCTQNGIVLADNDPISIGKHSLFQWTANTDELDEQNAYPISHEIDELISEEFRKEGAIYFDRKRDEIYFYSRSADPTVWVWEKSSKKWVCFNGFESSYFFEYDGETAFISGNKICIFQDDLTTDDETGIITAEFTSNPIDFGNLEDKHITALKAHATGGRLIFKLFFDGSDTPECVFEANDLDHAISKRISGKRFKYAVLQIIAEGTANQSVHSAELKAR